MKELEPQEVEALQSLRHNQAVMKLLRKRYDTARDALVQTPDTDLMKNVQGQAQALRHLLKAIDPESVD